jgi:hypothetical protein
MALAHAVRERNDRTEWTTLHELVAMLVEMVSIVRIEALVVAGVKRWSLPDPIHIPRPGEDKEDRVKTVSPGQFLRLQAAM